MGDMADDIIDAGIEELTAHQRGDCEGWCLYCEDEAKEAKRQARKKHKRPAQQVTGEGT